MGRMINPNGATCGSCCMLMIVVSCHGCRRALPDDDSCCRNVRKGWQIHIGDVEAETMRVPASQH